MAAVRIFGFRIPPNGINPNYRSRDQRKNSATENGIAEVIRVIAAAN